MLRSNTAADIAATRRWVVDQAKRLELSLSKEKLGDVAVAVSEAATNACKHGQDYMINVKVTALAGDLVVSLHARSHRRYQAELAERYYRQTPISVNDHGNGIPLICMLADGVALRDDELILHFRGGNSTTLALPTAT